MNVSRFEDFGLGSRRTGCLAFLGEGIFVHDGSAWEQDRKLLRRQFARVQFHDLSTFDQPVEDLVSSFKNCTGVADLQPAFFRFTLGTTTALLFGESVNYMNEHDQLEFGGSFDHASYVTAVRLRLADICWLYTPKSFTKSCDIVRKHANHFLQKALRCQKELGKEEAEKRYPFILDLYSELNDPVQVRDQLINVLLAGRDTTACTLSWAFFHLVRHQPAFKKLKEEVLRVTEGRTEITQQDIRRMVYLKAVLDETLRLYPQIPVNVRFAIRSTLLPKGGGSDGESPIFLPKGMGVGVTPYHMHRRKEIYGEDATEFRPERWLTGELDKVGNGYVPFHSGPRTCLGKDFALTEASYATVRVIQAYPNIRLPPNVVPEPVGQEKQSITIVVSSADGCKVLLE